MTAIILCPGPSLSSYTPQSADLIIGVNRAALLHECNWFCALDYPMIRDNAAKLLGSPSLLSRRQTVDDLRGRLDRFAEVKVIEDILAEFSPPGAEHPNSATSALIFAASQGAKRIAVYGADWDGVQDYDGVAAGEDRTDGRWRKERAMWEDVLMPWMAWRGTIVERVSEKEAVVVGRRCYGVKTIM